MLIILKPTLFNSVSIFSLALPRNLIRSALISSMVIVAIKARVSPIRISVIWAEISSGLAVRKRLAAFCMSTSVVPIPVVKVTGILTLIIWLDTPVTSVWIWIGFRDIFFQSWITGNTKVPPPWMILEGRIVVSFLPVAGLIPTFLPVLPKTTKISSLAQRR